MFSGRPPVEEDQPLSPEEHSWFDSGHAYVGRLFFAPAVWFDRFFSDETGLDPERALSFARLRTSLRLRQDGPPRVSLDLLADIRFPGLNKMLSRLRLIFSGEGDTTQDALDPPGSTSAESTRNQNRPNLELRFGAYRGVRATMDLGAGVFFRLPPAAFARLRFRLAVPINDVLVFQLAPQVFYRTDMLLGARASAEVDWPVAPSSVVRLGAASLVAQRRTHGLEYGTELVYSHAFTPRFAVALGTDAQGSTLDPVRFQKYRVYTRMRHDVFRRWLFVEVEPELGWPWTLQRGRYQAWAVNLRFEVQFEGQGAVEAGTRLPGE